MKLFPRSFRGRLALVLVLALAGLLAWRALHAASPDTGAAGGEMGAPGKDERILVVAPHPDDEVLGCGGLIQQARSRGAEVYVVLMTNGDASELALLFGERELSLKPAAYIALGKTRQQETLTALGSLGLRPEWVHFLGYPNNGLVPLWQFEHWSRARPYQSKTTKMTSSPYALTVTPKAPYCGSAVFTDLVALLREIRPTEIYVSHPRDTHADHWATAAFVSYALAAIAADPSQQWVEKTRLYGYLVHWPHFPTPRKANPRLALNPPAGLVQNGEQWVELPLLSTEAERKIKAVKMYRSQSPLIARLLPNLARRNELFELLSVQDTTPDKSLVWEDEKSGRHGLRGTEVLRTRARFAAGKEMQADFLRASPKLHTGAYISFDVRGLDQEGHPAGIQIHLLPRSLAIGSILEGDRLRDVRVTVKELSSGWTQVVGLDCPFEFDAPFVVTCWGSVRDKVTDPAVVARVSLTPAVAQ